MRRGKFPPELLQKIKDSVNILEIVGEHVVLKKSGANYTGLCPFHSERSPSFSVSENKQLYHCYGCKKGGDLFSFFMEIHGVTFPEAIEELAERARVKLPSDWAAASDDPEVEKKRAAAREKLALSYKLNRFVAQFYHQNLGKIPEILSYFRARGVGPEMERQFYVGAAPSGWDALAAHLTSKKAPLQTAVDLGLVRPSNKGSGYFDLFRNRAMFPILDMRGRVAGFGGRKMDQADEGPKYMNSPESPLFQKSKLVFGLFQAQKHIREKDEVILVEGYFDVLALHSAGFENVVATCGTSLTIDHLNLLRRFGSKITVLFDGDQAGVAATERAMELGLEHGIVLYGAVLPENLDPDEILFDQQTGSTLAGGREKMAEILAASKPLLDSRIQAAISGASSGPEARAMAIKQIGGWLRKFKDPIGQAVRLESVQKDLGITRGLLDQAMGADPRRAREPAPSRPAKPAQVIRRPQGRTRLSPMEKLLLGILAQGGPTLAKELAEIRGKMPPGRGLADLFEHPELRQFLHTLTEKPGFLELLRDNPKNIFELMVEEGWDQQVRSVITEALVKAEPIASPQEVRLVIERMMVRSWARFSQYVKAAIADAEAKQDAGLQAKLMKEYLDVQRKMKEFNSFYDEA